MTTIIKLVVVSVLALLLSSCNIGVRGNGNVKTVERPINGTFNEIEISHGLEVILTQADEERIAVQADENLQDIIKTKLEGKVLKIYADENISFSEAKKVMVNFQNVSKITASSGSDVFSSNTFNMENIELVTSSGSDMTLTIHATTIDGFASSGSDLQLSGKTTTLIAEASSGSGIDAKDLVVQIAHVKANSGADIRVQVSKELYANASTGGDIKYHGDPEKIEKTDHVSGSVSSE